MQRFEGKVAVITGGAGRIGAASARRLASEGARVAIADLNVDAARTIADEIGEAAHALQFDGSSGHFGRIDVLHNNAALLDLAFLARDLTAVDTDIEVWDRTMEVNARGYVVACKHVIPYMFGQGGGAITNTASNAAAAGDSSRIAYGSSKGAILMMTKYIARYSMVATAFAAARSCRV